MNTSTVVSKIEQKLRSQGGLARIPLQRGGYFTAKLVKWGVEVDNLGTQPFLPWIVFREAFNLLNRNHGAAVRGNAMDSRLGDKGLPLNSVEGHIASVVYGKQIGDSVFRRITPVACILVWAGICRSEPGKLLLS